MVLRYIVRGTNCKNAANSMQSQGEALLRNAISMIDLNDNDDYYDDLMELLHKYPSHVISSCHDHMGNTILHMIFSRRQRGESDIGKSRLTNDFSIFKTKRKVLHRRRRSAKGNDIVKRKVTFLQLVNYLTHCSDRTPDEFTYDEAIIGSDVNVVTDRKSVV